VGYASLMDEQSLARSLASYFGFSEEDGDAARAALSPWPEGFTIRFSELARFAKQFGVDLLPLAEFIARTSTGIEPWVSKDTLSKDDWERIDRAIEETRAEHRGAHWAETILSLLNELDAVHGTPERD